MSARERRSRTRRPDLSQHFLRDPFAERLIQATSISPSDLVVEVGAGRGALTRPLAARTRRLIAVELDAYLAERLRREFSGRAEVIEADFRNYTLPREPYRVVGNIPFGASMDIIRRIVDASQPPDDAWLVVQRELAYRLCGPPFTTESLTSLTLKPFWHLEIVQRLSRDAFSPPPSVESVVLHFAHRARPIIGLDQRARFQALLDHGFRGLPTVRQALKPLLSRVQLRRLAADFRFRDEDGPSALLFEQWLGIFRFLNTLPGTRE